MLGAIIGDIVGSPYEWDNIHTTDFPLMTAKSDFTDDSVMTIAVAKALMDSYGADDETIKEALVMNMQNLGRHYPNRGYGGRFRMWLQTDQPKPYNSFGNGSAMRVAAAGWLYRTLEETLHAAELTSVVTHDHPEGVKGAQSIAAAIFLARARVDKEDIRTYLVREFGYDLYRTLDEIRPTYQFDETCQGSVPESIIAFMEGKGYVDTIRKAISIGGDSDTIAAIAGSIAEAYYGIPEQVEKQAFDRLPTELRSEVYRFRQFYVKNSGRPIDGWQGIVYSAPDADLKQLTNIEAVIRDFYARSGSAQPDANPVLEAVSKAMCHGAKVVVPVDRMPKFRGTGDTDSTVQLLCIRDAADHVFLPVFTSRSEVDKGNHPNLITDELSACVDSALNASNVDGLIINPYGQNFVLNGDALKFVTAKAYAEAQAEKEGPVRVQSTLDNRNTEEGAMTDEELTRREEEEARLAIMEATKDKEAAAAAEKQAAEKE